MQTTINQRFKEAFEKLKERGMFKTQREFVESLKWNQSTLSDVLKGKRPLPVKIAITFCDKYKVNQEWLLQGKGRMFSDGEPRVVMPDAPNLSAIEKENIMLHKMLEDKQRTIEAYEKTILWLEHLINVANKKFAGVTSVKKN